MPCNDSFSDGPTFCRRREYWFPVFLGVIMVFAAAVPYVYGYVKTPPGQMFMGFVGRGTPGANGYFLFERQAQEGYHFMCNRMTPEPLPRTFFNLEWWALGKVARWSGLSLIAVFYLECITAIFGYVLALYYLTARCLNGLFLRRLAVTLICFGAGLGWIIWALNRELGTHLIVPRDINGVCIAGYLINKPHFIRGAICSLLTYAFLIEGERSGKTRYFVYSGLTALAHSLMRPYHMPELYLVYALYPVLLNLRAGVWAWGRFRNYIIAGAVHFPAVLYYAWMFFEQTLGMSGWERKPGFLIEYVLWIGWPFLICAACLPWLMRLRTAKDSSLLLGLWILITWLICNLYPYWIAGQEVAIYSFPVVSVLLTLGGPLCWLAETVKARWGWDVCAPGRARAWRWAGAAALVLLSMPSTAIVYRQMFQNAHPYNPSWAYYISEDYYAGLTWLDEHTPADAVVLASETGSQFLFRFTKSKSVTGHDMLTSNWPEKSGLVQRFYAQPGDEAFKQDLVKRFNVRYVIVGDFERQAGSISPEALPWLKPVFAQGGMKIYEVVNAG